MSAENNIRFIHSLTNYLNQRNVAVIDTLYAPHFALQGIVPGQPTDRETLKKGLAANWVAFPDMVEIIEDAVADDTTVMTRGFVEGTHSGQFVTFAPTGKRVRAAVASVFRIEGGQIVAQWTVTDLMQIIRQIQGVVA